MSSISLLLSSAFSKPKARATHCKKDDYSRIHNLSRKTYIYIFFSIR